MATRVIAPPRAETQLRERSQVRAEGERLLVEIFLARKRRSDAAVRIAAVIERLRRTPDPRRH